MQKRSWPKRIVRIALFVALALAVARVVLITGLVRPVRVQSGSMAGFLLGPNTTCSCPDCGFELTWGHDNPPQDRPPVCPNCGYTGRMRDVAQWQGGRVLIDRGPLVFRGPARWEVVALRGPPGAEPLITKRVTGLPGETIAIERGEILVNGKLVRKSFDMLREVAVPVYNDAFRLTQSDAEGKAYPARFRPGDDFSGWTATEMGYKFTPSGSERAAPNTADRLVYHHWPCTGPPSPRAREGAVVDLDPYNQGLSRSLNDVSDLYVRFQLQAAPNAIISVQFRDGDVVVPVIFDFEYFTVRAAAGDEGILQEAAIPRSMTTRDSLVEVALCDAQVFVAVNGREFIRAEYQRSAAGENSATPFLFGAERAGVEVSHIELLRDIYYVCPDGTGRSWTRPEPLGASEYFLLGDNSPASDDSRTWPNGGAIDRGSIIGVVRKW